MKLVDDEFMPLVSMCIPVYNHERFVRASIKSVIEQSYKNIELIVIDDGSSDSSVDVITELLEECRERFVRFAFFTRPNAGVSATLNEGLEWSRGKYFSGLASDDAICPDKTNVLVEHLEKNPQCIGVFGSIHLIDDDGVRLGFRRKPGVYNFRDVFLLRAEVPAPASMLRREELLKVEGFDVSTRIEDWEMWLKLTHTNNTYLEVLPDLLAEYRQHPANTWKQIDLMHQEQVKIIHRYADESLFPRAATVLACMKFRNLSIARKREAFKALMKLLVRFDAYREMRFYQGLVFLVFRW
ncbi:glycosyltransferase [Pseudomonas fluorescens]|nr:glycosyltransferase [Pseudomonas fluorescens]NKI54514.1 glycosyltransferase [Pseudomonas fluorescens]NKI66176.1 glycosyltransferase [Pseudomonas fluorescens]TKK38185.1 glycosyl transferase family 2 [Pseudomonas fluorescens]